MSPTFSVPESGCLLPGDHAEERRLAGAVRADHADDARGRKRERHVLDEQPVAEALLQMVGLDDEIAETRPRRNVHLDLVELHVLLLREQLLVRAETRLRLVVPRLRAHAHPLELARERAAARRLRLLLDREPLLLLLEPRRVVALERNALAAVELEDPARDVVEEVPVMRHGDDRALVVGEEALEPRDRLGVEMVRRLVEQEQAGRREQQPAQRDAASLAARQRRDVAVAIGEPQRVHRVVEVLLELPRVGAVDRVLHLGLVGEQRLVVGVGLCERRRDLIEAVEQVA